MPLILIVAADGELSTVADACGEQAGWQVVSVNDLSNSQGELEDACPHVIVTDVWPAGGDDELLQSVRRDFPDVPLVIVSEDEQATVRALGLGASSYVARSRLSRDLITTIQRVLDLTGIEDRENLSPHLQLCHQEFNLPNDSTVIASTVRYMRKMAETVGICGRHDSHRLSIALDEALMNAMVHGNLEISSRIRENGEELYRTTIEERLQQRPFRDRQLSLTASLTPEAATFVIRDEGPGFEPDAVPDPTAPENLEKPHGRGLVLMKVFMDDVTFNDRGNEVTLIKRVSQHADSCV